MSKFLEETHDDGQEVTFGEKDEHGRKPPKLWKHYHDFFFLVINDEGEAESPFFLDFSGAKEWRLNEGCTDLRILSIRFDPNWQYGVQIEDDPKEQAKDE